MKSIRLLLIASILLLLTSCYYKQLYYSFEVSHGGVVVGSSYYYLAQVREYQQPKGISRFPDGGMSKEIRQLFGLFKTDSVDNSTILLAKFSNIYGWPAKYSTRLDFSQSYIAIGLKNVSFPDSLDGIYLYSLKKGDLKRYNHTKSLPALSPVKSEIAYCVGNKLCIDDLASGTLMFSYLLNSEPVFVSWSKEQEILLFYSNPFLVKMLNLENGKVTNTDLKYIPNYNQNLDATSINRLLKESNIDLKGLLDKR